MFLHTATDTFCRESGRRHHLPTSAFMNVMIMMCVEQGALNSPVIRMILHCQGPMLPSQARIWSPSSLSLPASSSTSPMVTDVC